MRKWDRDIYRPTEIARYYLPTIYHRVDDEYRDAITPVYFGNPLKTLLQPTVYYQIVDHLDYKTIIYHFFHREDWSDSIFNIVKSLDSHPFDWEGLIKCINNEGEVLWTATRSHYELLFTEGDIVDVKIESQSHAVKPLGKDFHIKGKTRVYQPSEFDLVNLQWRYKLFEERIFPIFAKAGIDRWQQWNDWLIFRRFGLRTVGLIEKDPMKLYKYARACQRVKNV